LRLSILAVSTAVNDYGGALRRRVGFGEFPFAVQKPAKETPEFGAYCQHYLEAYARRACKPNTVRGYEVIIDRHLVPAWQGKRLDEITRADVKQLLLAKGAEGYAAGTVKNIKLMVSALFTHAYEDEILSHNPALNLGRFLPKVDRRKHLQPLTREQAVVFLAAAREHFSDFYALLLCAFRTGMRMGELRRRLCPRRFVFSAAVITGTITPSAPSGFASRLRGPCNLPPSSPARRGPRPGRP
jgi:integrase